MKDVKVLIGNYGSGKSELALNFAIGSIPPLRSLCAEYPGHIEIRVVDDSRHSRRGDGRAGKGVHLSQVCADAIAACTIGGVSTTGGVGTVPGVLVGVLVFELMKVALQFMNVNSSYTYIVQGLVIIVAVAIDIRKYLAKK